MATQSHRLQAALLLLLGSFLSVCTHASTQASAGVASTYLFRGVDYSDGSAQVFGDFTYKTDLGLYTSIWGSSAGSNTQEYDLILGWSKDYDGLNINTGMINYVYPGNTVADDFGSESEFYIGMGYQGFEAYLYRNIASAWSDKEGYTYTAFSYTYKKFSGTLGYAMDHSIPDAGGVAGNDGKYDYLHLDLTFAFNDNLSFTFSKMLTRSADLDSGKVRGSEFADLATADNRFSVVRDDDMLFVLTYSLPLEI